LIRERQLNGYKIHGCDVEQLCRRALRAYTASTHSRIPADDVDDYLGWLLEETVKLAQRFDPAAGVAFDKYAYPLLRLRVVDHVRRTAGRTRWAFGDHVHERDPRPAVLSLDAPAGHDDHALDREVVLGATLAPRVRRRCGSSWFRRRSRAAR